MQTDLLEQPQLQPAQEIRPYQILIVDDDEALSDILSRRLKNQGYSTIVAKSGQEGLDVAFQHCLDLIVLDLRLPDTDGFTICQELSDSTQTCAIPVIILSAMERPDVIRRSRAAGCLYFVRKPYDPNALLVLIRQAIQEARCWQMT